MMATWCLLVCSLVLFTAGQLQRSSIKFFITVATTYKRSTEYILCVRFTLTIIANINAISFWCKHMHTCIIYRLRTWISHSSSMGHLPCDSIICTHDTSVQTSEAGLKRVDGQVPAVDTVGAVVGWDLHVVKQPMQYVSITCGAVQVHCVSDIRFLICTGMRQKHCQRRRLPVYSKERRIFQCSHQIQTITTQCTNVMVKNSVVAQPNTQATRIPRSFCTYKHKR